MPVLDKLGELHAARGVAVLALNIDADEQTYQQYVDSNQYSYVRLARDGAGTIREAYRVRGVPTTYVVDDAGIIQYVHVGYGSEIEEALAEEVASLVEQ